MTLNQWALRWSVQYAALAELKRELGHEGTDAPVSQIGSSEAAVQSRVRLAASQLGWRAWRNNVGAGMLSDGTHLRYGLANESQRLNESMKSSDLIGIRPRLIGPSDVGSTIGQFVSLEIKRADWRFTGMDREVAQEKWLGMIVSLGGYGRFVTDAGQLS